MNVTRRRCGFTLIELPVVISISAERLTASLSGGRIKRVQ